MRATLNILIALLAGFCGGFIGARLPRPSDQLVRGKTVRASTFELIDEEGNAISFWGIDKTRHVVLAFGDSRSVLSPPAGPNPGDLREVRNQAAVIGMGGYMPFMNMRPAGKMGEFNVLFTVEGQPFLLMKDETGPRLGLGIVQYDTPTAVNSWALSFNPALAGIGIQAAKNKGEQYVQGFSFVDPNRVKFPQR